MDSKLAMIIIISLTLALGTISAQQKTNIAKHPEPPNAYYTLWNINNLSGWIRNDGNSGSNPYLNFNGTTYPRQTASVVFRDGLVWGGIVQDNNPSKPALRVGGQNYIPGTTSGYIVTPGPNPVPSGSPLRIFRVRRDYNELTTSSADVILDAAELFNIDTSLVTEQQAQSVLDQYAMDWQEWPATLGAPFYDNNGNGMYEPAIDEPGLADADQVLWFVVHDLDSLVTTGLYGSPPIGLEIQTTLWGYKGEDGGLRDMTFQRFRVLNKSGFPIDSMYFSRWADVDLGRITDDFVGCDSLLDLGFVYNGLPEDSEYRSFNLAPAAFGYLILQGPTVLSAGDSATVNFSRIAGNRNLGISAFGYFSSGVEPSEPGPYGQYEATEEWFGFMKGIIYPGNRGWYVGSGPNLGQSTNFPLHGDPVVGSDDIDGMGNNPQLGDRRFHLSTGPFSMQPGDSQEVIYALIGGLGENRYDSITKLKKNRKIAASLQKSLFRNIPTAVNFSSRTIYSSTQVNEVRFQAENQDATAMEMLLKTRNGFPITTLPLFDDGQHNDGVAGDGIWGNSWFTTPAPSAVSADLDVTYQQGFDFLWEDIETTITTSGPVRIARAVIGSDNYNQDGIANPGENIRFTLEVENQGSFNYANLRINQIKALQPLLIQDLKVVNNEPLIASLPGNSSYLKPYSPSEPFFSLTIDDNFPIGDSLELVYSFITSRGNVWTDRVSIVIESLPNDPLELPMTKISGNTEGLMSYRIFDSSLLNGSNYRLTFNEENSRQEFFYTLENITIGDTLAESQPFPDEQAHNTVTIDGFSILPGTATPADSVGDWQWFGGDRWLDGVDWGGRSFLGGADLGGDFFGSTLEQGDYRDVRIVFDSTMVTNANVFRRDLGYMHNGLGTFPGAAYDIEDPANPRRLNIIFVEDANVGSADLMWNPDTLIGGREHLFIMNSDYDPVTGGGYTQDAIIFGGVPTLWGMWLRVEDGFTFLQNPGVLELYVYNGIELGLSYEFTPEYPTGIEGELNKPLTFELAQNYPNPFNPETTIKFQLPIAQKTTLQIYNVLGQKVATLVDDKLSAGSYSLRWKGINDIGSRVSSGVYFYRIESGDFVKTRKMLLVR